MELADGALPPAGDAGPQAGAPTLDAATDYLVPRIIPTVTFRQPSPGSRASIEPMLNTARKVKQPSTRASNSTPTLLTLGEAAATSLLFVGGSLFLTLLVRRRSQRQAILRAGYPQTVGSDRSASRERSSDGFQAAGHATRCGGGLHAKPAGTQAQPQAGRSVDSAPFQRARLFEPLSRIGFLIGGLLTDDKWASARRVSGHACCESGRFRQKMRLL
jgi:hypothetical protein